MKKKQPFVPLLALLLLGACARPSADAPDPASPAARAAPVVVGTYAGSFASGVFELVATTPDGRAAQHVVAPLPTQASGASGTTTPAPGTILLHQVGPRALDGACNAPPYGDPGVPSPFQGVCVQVQAISGFPTPVRRLHVQLTSLTYCGPTLPGSVTTYVKAPSEPPFLDNTLGLWSYGNLTPAGTANDRRTVNWYFETSDPGASACFRFTAEARGELVGGG